MHTIMALHNFIQQCCSRANVSSSYRTGLAVLPHHRHIW